MHNVHKIYRVLEKSNYISRFHSRIDVPSHKGETDTTGSKHGFNSLQSALEAGCPQTYSRILRYLTFDSSNAFTAYLRTHGVDPEMQYMTEAKFLRELTKVLINLFKYRVALAPEQFI